MSEQATDPSITRGYSLPRSVHERIGREAQAHGFSKSDVVHQALRLWFRVNGKAEDDEAEKEAS